jgi:hypothetical protein
MLHGSKPAHRTLVDYLACYQRGVPAGRLSARLNEAVPNPTEKMIQHFKHWQDTSRMSPAMARTVTDN